jgi:hypothetical protein
MLSHLLSPVILAFVLGLFATWVKSDLRIPDELHSTLSLYLLLAIGLKGGASLSGIPLQELWLPAGLALTLGVVTPCLAYFLARRTLKTGVGDSAALAAHYGSVSAVTFLATLEYLDGLQVAYAPYVVALLALLEVPAIIVALAIARSRLRSEKGLWASLREVIVSKSVFLLIGGLALGWIGGPGGLERVAPLFVGPFQGVLLLFLLDLGMLTARRLSEVRALGLRPIVFGIAVPLLHSALALAAGLALGLDEGTAVVLATLAASASYIAAPAAVRLALPQANPGLYLGLSLGVTFPFNITLGIPLYHFVATWVSTHL